MDDLKDGSFEWNDPESTIGKVDELQAIYYLHKNIWTVALLNNRKLSFCYEKILYPRERQVVDLKVDGLTDGEVAIKLGLSLSTVKRYIYNIRYVYRNNCRDRVWTNWGKWLAKVRGEKKRRIQA